MTIATSSELFAIASDPRGCCNRADITATCVVGGGILKSLIS